MRGATVQVICENCKEPFDARVSDRKRGWGKFCSKSCKATKQEKKTGQYKKFRATTYQYEDNDNEFSNAHLFSNEDHDCNKDY